jgi:predicted small lipoprotein YifL
MRAALLLSVLALAACGVDGPPVAPDADGQPAAGPGTRVTIGGTATVGVSGGRR